MPNSLPGGLAADVDAQRGAGADDTAMPVSAPADSPHDSAVPKSATPATSAPHQHAVAGASSGGGSPLGVLMPAQPTARVEASSTAQPSSMAALQPHVTAAGALRGDVPCSSPGAALAACEVCMHHLHACHQCVSCL